jgi:hypothetical protein
MTTQSNLPVSIKVISVIAILWNLFGVASFVMHAFFKEMSNAGLNEAQISYMESFPGWAYIIFGTAVTTGLLGSIGLFFRKKWTPLLFLISLITLVINQFHPILFTNYMEIFGGITSIIFPVIITALGVYFWYYSRSADQKGWLNN